MAIYALGGDEPRIDPTAFVHSNLNQLRKERTDLKIIITSDIYHCGRILFKSPFQHLFTFIVFQGIQTISENKVDMTTAIQITTGPLNGFVNDFLGTECIGCLIFAIEKEKNEY